MRYFDEKTDRFVDAKVNPRKVTPPTGSPSLFDAPATGEALRDKGMQESDDHASLRWRELADQAIVLVSGILPEFTTDDVWAALEQSGRDAIETERNPSAMGAAMARMARAGMIIRTGTTKPSARPSRHVAEMRVWRKTTPDEYRQRQEGL